MWVQFNNQAAVESSFSVQWNGGESGRTKTLGEGQSDTIDLSTSAGIPTDPQGCWVRAYPAMMGNHDSGENFTYDPNDSGGVTYDLFGDAIHGVTFTEQ